MYINKLVYFISVAENLNFTKAAKECHLAQPAISQQIYSLERELGFQLFIRTSKSVELTDAGRTFYEDVKNIVEGYKTAVKKAESVAYGFKGMLTIGICGGTEEAFLPKLLKRFKEMYPLIEIKFKKATFNDISKQLEHKVYDIVFTWPYDLEGVKNINHKIIFEDEACAMVSYNNKISENNTISRENLALENNVMVAYEENSMIYNHFQKFYGKYNIETKSIITVADSQILNLMIELNMGVSIVPKAFRELNNNRFAFVEIEGEPHVIKFCVAYLKDNTNPCVELFVNNASIR